MRLLGERRYGERKKKKNFSECEVEVLISEVEARNNILFGSLSSGISTKTKTNLLTL